MNKSDEITIMKGSRQCFIWKVSCLVAVLLVLSSCGKVGISISNEDDDFLSTINDGIQSANIVFSNQIAQKYVVFEEQYGLDYEKVGPYWEQAQVLREESTDLINFIEFLKWDLVRKTENKNVERTLAEGLLKSTDTLCNGRKFYDINISKVKSRDNYNKPTAYMMGEPAGNGKAFELAEKIRKFRAEIFKVVGPEHIHEMGLMTDSIFNSNREALETDAVREYNVKVDITMIKYYGAKIDYAPETADPLQKGWEYHNFHHAELVADVTLLNKLIMEVQTAELNAVNQLMTNIPARDYKYDEMGAMVFAESNNVLSGQTYHAQAMVAAWQNTQTMAYVKLDGGAEKVYTSDGRGVINLEFNCGVGQHKYTGYIKMLDPSTGELKDFPFENTFTVSSPFSN